MAEKPTVYALAISIPASKAEQLGTRIEGNSLTRKLEIMASTLLEEFADGAIVIPSDYSKRLDENLGKLDYMQIVERLEKAAGRQGDQVILEMVVDPSNVPSLQQQADYQGKSLKELLKSHGDYIFCQGWLGNRPPDGMHLSLTLPQYRALQEYMGKDPEEIVTGADVIAYLRGQGKVTSAEAAEADLNEVAIGE